MIVTYPLTRWTRTKSAPCSTSIAQTNLGAFAHVSVAEVKERRLYKSRCNTRNGCCTVAIGQCGVKPAHRWNGLHSAIVWHHIEPTNSIGRDDGIRDGYVRRRRAVLGCQRGSWS